MPDNNIAQLLKLLQGPSQPKRQGFDPNVMADESLDPSVRADMGNSAMQSELRDRRFQARRTVGPGPNDTNPNEVAALTELLGGYDKERSDPNTMLNRQRDEVQGMRENEVESIQQGFTGNTNIEPIRGDQSGAIASASMSPVQQREIYKRGQAEANSPSAIHKITEDAATYRQGRSLNAQNRNVNAQMAPAMERADLARQQWEDIRSGKIDPNTIRSLGATGAIGFQTPQRTPQVNPNNLLGAVQKEMGYLQEGGSTDPFATFGQPNSPSQSLDYAVRAYVANSGLHQDDQAEIYDILSNPQYRTMPIAQLSQQLGWDANDPDYPKFISILGQLTGQH